MRSLNWKDRQEGGPSKTSAASFGRMENQEPDAEHVSRIKLASRTRLCREWRGNAVKGGFLSTLRCSGKANTPIPGDDLGEANACEVPQFVRESR